MSYIDDLLGKSTQQPSQQPNKASGGSFIDDLINKSSGSKPAVTTATKPSSMATYVPMKNATQVAPAPIKYAKNFVAGGTIGQAKGNAVVPSQQEINKKIAVEKTLEDTKKGLDTSKKIANDVLTFLPRATVRVATTLAGKEEYVPQGKVQNAVLGNRPVKNISGEGKEFNEAVGIPTNTYTNALTGIGLTALDFSGFGGGKAVKTFTEGEVPEKFIKYVTKVKNPASIERTLTEIGMQDKALAKAMSNALAKTRTRQETVDVLTNFGKTEASTVNSIESEIPKTARVWIKSKFSEGGGYADVPIIRKEENITLYQGGNDERRQFWTPDKKYAAQFGDVKEKTGSFYRVDNGNRMTDVYVDASKIDKGNIELYKGAPSEKAVVDQVAKAGTEAEVATVLKGNVKNITPEQIQKIAPVLAVAKDPEVISNAIATVTKDTGVETKPSVIKGPVTTTILNKLEGRTTVSKQFIQDLTNSGDVKQVERDLIRKALESERNNVDVGKFIEKVQSEVLPLKVKNSDSYTPEGKGKDPFRMVEEGAFTPKYEGVSLPSDIRGGVANYKENIYESPITTSAGAVHFNYQTKNYFGHTRVEDMADDTTRRVIEVQSDLYQKGNLEKEIPDNDTIILRKLGLEKEHDNLLEKVAEGKATPREKVELNSIRSEINKFKEKGKSNIARLQQYANPTAHFRMVREEVKRAAQDGKEKLLFPTGETAMKIEGLGAQNNWFIDPVMSTAEINATPVTRMREIYNNNRLTTEQLKVGSTVRQGGVGGEWIIIDVLEDGKFKAIPKSKTYLPSETTLPLSKQTTLPGGRVYNAQSEFAETFDISGKVDTNNPIYRFYEKDLARYLNSNYKASKIVDDKGVSWYEVKVDKSQAEKPVVAFRKGRSSEYDLTVDQAHNELRKMFTEEEMSLRIGDRATLARLLETNDGSLIRGLLGFYSPDDIAGDMIGLLQRKGMVSSKTLYHESFHGYLTRFVDKAERKQIIDYVMKNKITKASSYLKYKGGYKTPEERAEEWLADDFANYVKTGKADAKLLPFYKRIIEAIRKWIREKGSLEKLYKRILSKDRTTPRQSFNPREARYRKGKDDGLISSDGKKLGREEGSKSVPDAKVELGKETKLKVSKATAKTPSGVEEVSLLKSGGKSSSSDTISQDFDADKYVKEQVGKRETARKGVSEGVRGKVSSFVSTAKTKLVDFTSPIEDILNQAVKAEKKPLPPSQDIHNQIDRALRAPTLAGQFAKDKGLVDVIKKVPDIDKLDQYLIARHAMELEKMGIKTGRDLAKDEALTKVLEEKYSPFAKKVTKYAEDLLDYSVDTGLISKELATALKEKYPTYVPFNRVFDEIEKTRTSSRGVASLSKQSVVQKIEGSAREIESPVESLLAKTSDAFKQGEKNVAGKILASYKDIKGNPFGLKEITGEEVGGRDTISFLDNGKKRVYETTKEVAEAAKALNVQQLNILGQIFALPVRVARLGLTGINLPFIGANIAKDAVTAFINSNHGLRTSIANPVNFMKSLFSAVKHDKLYDEMIRAGGGGTSFDISRNQVSKTVKQIRSDRGVGSKILYTVKNPSELLRAVENIVGRAEEFTRIQQFRGTKQALLDSGMSEKDASIGAARQAREATVNFARRGEWGTVLNAAFLYLNASIQGTRTLLRNLKTKPGSTAFKIALSTLAPVAIITAWNMDDEDRKKAYEDIADYEKENNIIIIPPNPTKDAKGKWNVIKIPLSQEVNNLANIPRRMMEQAHGMDPIKFREVADALIGTASPVKPTQGSLLSTFTPQAIKPTIEGAANKNLFTGLPQVPKSLENLSPKNQIKSKTSGTAIEIGRKLNVSPIKVEEWIKGTFGGVGSQALNTVDKVLASASVIPKGRIGGQDVLEAITARFSKAQGGKLDDKAVNEIKGILELQADKRNELKTKAEELDAELKDMSPEDAKARFSQIAKEDPKLAQKLIEAVEERKLGLSYEEKLIKQLGVENGERARYIFDQIEKLPDDKKKKYYANLIEKKLITKQIASQLQILKSKR